MVGLAAGAFPPFAPTHPTSPPAIIRRTHSLSRGSTATLKDLKE